MGRRPPTDTARDGLSGVDAGGLGPHIPGSLHFYRWLHTYTDRSTVRGSQLVLHYKAMAMLHLEDDWEFVAKSTNEKVTFSPNSRIGVSACV